MSGSYAPEQETRVYQVAIAAQGGTFGAGGASQFFRTPDKVRLNFDSSWSPLLSDVAQHPFLQFAAGQLGKSLINLYAQAQVWTGSQPIHFRLDLELVARTSSINEVILPIKFLAKLCLPVLSPGGFLDPPGPRLMVNANGAYLGGTRIDVMIGYCMYFKDCIIKFVTPDFILQMDTSGQPMKALVGIEVFTYWVATVNMIDEIFIGAAGFG